MEKLILSYNARCSGARGTQLTFVCTRTGRQIQSHTFSTCIHTLTQITPVALGTHTDSSPPGAPREPFTTEGALQRGRERDGMREVFIDRQK